MTLLRLVAARAVDDDARLVMAFRNDPIARAASFHTEEKRWPAFRDEYLAYFDAPIAPLFGALDASAEGESETRVGFVRFRACADPEGRAGNLAVDISINVAPAFRGRGYGARLIALASAEALGRADVVLAEIRPGNLPSTLAFQAAGYRRLDDGVHDVDGRLVPVERHVLHRAW